MKNKLIVHNQKYPIDKKGIEFYDLYLKENAGCIS